MTSLGGRSPAGTDGAVLRSPRGGRDAVVEAPPMREVMSRFATGVVVLTVGGEHVHGMTANAFNSVSLDPPLVLCCIARTAVMHEAITGSGRFAVSVMGAEQEGLARYFADKKRPLGPEQFDSVDWRPGPHTGAPLIDGAIAWLECELRSTHDGGDHSVFIGEVLDAGYEVDGNGLLFFNGSFLEGAARPR